MFTGLIEDIGKIKSIAAGDILSLTIESRLSPELNIGDSVCTNGVCLTVVKKDSGSFSAQAMPETLENTTLKNWKQNDRVNLERALTLNSRLGGHLLSGHVDETGEIIEYKKSGADIILTIKIRPENSVFLCPKGSIAIDGISLTVNDVGADFFTVNIIPHTLKHTNLDDRKTGDKINLEYDILAKYVYRQQVIAQKKLSNKPQSKIDENFLKDQGFI